MKYFTDIDINYIQYTVGREVKRNELKILYECLYPALEKRSILPRSYVEQIMEKKGQRIHLNSETRLVKDDGVWKSYGDLIRNFSLYGFWPEHLAYIWTYSPTKIAMEKIQETDLNNSLGIASFSHHILEIAKNSKTGRVIIIGMACMSDAHPRVKTGWLIGKIALPGFGKTMLHEKRLYKQFSPFTSQLKGFSACGSRGNDLRKLLELVPDNLGLQLNFPSKYKKGDGILLLDNTLVDSEGKFPFSLNNDIQIIGQVLPEPRLNIDFGDGSMKKWPRAVTRITLHDNTDIPEKTNSQNINTQDKRKKTAHITVTKKMILKDMENSKTNFNQHLYKSDWNIYSNSGLVNGNNIYAFDLGMRSVVDGARYLACLGTTVDTIYLNSNVNNKNFLAGQLHVLKGLQLNNIGLMNLGDDIPLKSYHVFAAGQSVSINKDIALDGEFICLIGTLKGELGSSLYSEISGYHHNSKYPVMDMVMEKNVNQTLAQLVQLKIVKWAQAIGRGGLAMGLYKLYCISGTECGFKIHMTIDLRAEEYLFGESFGAALLVLSGSELMEFQRLCMQYNVPATTIGRVNTKKEITVNNDLKISRNVLESFWTIKLD